MKYSRIWVLLALMLNCYTSFLNAQSVSYESICVSDLKSDTVYNNPLSLCIAPGVYPYVANTTLLKRFDFRDQELSTNARFANCTFDTTDFVAIKGIDRKIFIENCRFLGSTYMSEMELTNYSIINTWFHNRLEVKSLVSKEKLDIVRCCFLKSVSFEDCVLRDLSFYNCTFKGKLSLKNCQLIGKVNFTNANLPKYIDLTNLKTEQELDLTKVALLPGNGERYINLSGADISKIKMNYQMFRLTFDKEKSVDEKCSVYEALLKKFSGDGFVEGYKKLDIEYRKFKYASQGSYVGWIDDLWWNFGYDKERIFISAFFMLLLFTAINFWQFAFITTHVYTIENIVNASAEAREIVKTDRYFNKTIYSLWYTAIIFFGLRLEIDKMKFTYPWWAAYVMLIYVSGLICLGFIVNLILK